MNDTVISITRDITCLKCGHNGVMDIRDEEEDAADSRLFLSLGHNPFSGDLHYLCPACDILLLIDPMLALGEKPIMGIPRLRTGKKTVREEGALQGFVSGLLAKIILGENEEFRLL